MSKSSLYKSDHEESPPLSYNKWIDRLTRCHPVVPFLLFIPVIVFFGYRAFAVAGIFWWAFVGLWLLALVFWTSLEYFIHRFLFHYKPTSDFGKKFVYAAHWVHHDYPNDKTRIVLPPSVTIPGGVLFYLLSLWLMGVLYADAFFSGLVASYLFYDWNHYAAHHYHYKNKWFQIMKQHHLKHHFTDPDKKFGFTTTLWDKLFQTEK